MSTVIPMEVDEYARIAAAEDDHWWYWNTRALAQVVNDSPPALTPNGGPSQQTGARWARRGA